MNCSVAAAAHVARWWEPQPGGKVHCYLCPRHCRIGDGQTGFCFIRANHGGVLYNLGYAHPAALQIDPIEKKPLHHFLPGSTVFSLGTAGCNLGCFFCQNWDLSKSRADQVRAASLGPEEVVDLALRAGCPSLAFTYNEPTIWAEYAVDIARLARARGLHTVVVTNGYISREAFFDLYDFVDAANVDLKAITEEFYARITLSHLEPVLQTLQWLRWETRVWLEITHLVIPTLNDHPSEIRDLAEWILKHLGSDVPLHFTTFHPAFRLLDKPATPPESLERARSIAREVGLHYVYAGNASEGGAHTFCPNCGKLLIRRSGYSILATHLREGHCPACGEVIPGRWQKLRGQSCAAPPAQTSTSPRANQPRSRLR